MAGFGFSTKKATPFDPTALTRADKINLFGATLRDVGAALNGDEGGAVPTTQAIIGQRAAALRQKQLLQDLTAALTGQAAPTSSGEVATSERFSAPALVSAAGPKVDVPALPQRRRGLPTLSDAGAPLIGAILGGVPGADKIVDLLAKAAPDIAVGPNGEAYSKNDPSVVGRRFGNPTVVNGRVLDLNDTKNLDTYVPEAPVKGAVPVYGPEGKSAAPVGWQLPNGALQAIESTEAASSQGKARGAAPFEFVDVPTPDGRKGVIAKSAAAGRTFVGQSPTEAAQAENAVTAAKGLPGVIASADQALGLIDEVKNSDQLDARTGLSSMFWAVPGTAGVGFDDRVNQLKGGVFLQAFNQLKGGGAITEVEGKKAEQAIARLNQRQSKGDFLKSLTDLSDVIKAGKARAARSATPPASSGGRVSAPTSGSGYTIVGVRRAGQ